jgi:hypothetical protein
MELEFTATGAGRDGELLIHLDVDGLAALLAAVEAAIAQGRGELIPAGFGPPGAFGKVTVTFEGAGRSGDRERSGAWIVPDAAPAGLPLSAGR